MRRLWVFPAAALGLLALVLAGARGRPLHARPRTPVGTEPRTAEDPPRPAPGRDEPSAAVAPGHTGYDAEPVSGLLAFLVDPAHRDEAFLERRVKAAGDLAAAVEAGGEPFLREALRQMQDPLHGRRERAQQVLALAKELPGTLLDDLRHHADPLVARYPELRAETGDGHACRGDAGFLGDGPLLDVADEVRAGLWPESEPTPDSWGDEHYPEWEANIRGRLDAWWKEIPPQDRYLLAEDALLLVARDIAKSWIFNSWRFVALLRWEGEHWRLAGLRRFRTHERVARVVVEDFDGDGSKDAALWLTVASGWTWSRLLVVGLGCPDGVIAKPAAYGNANHIVLLAPRMPGEPWRFGIGSIFLPTIGGHAIYLAGVIARESVVVEWTGAGLRTIGSVWIPLR